VKRVAPEILSLVLERHGHADLRWTLSIAIPDDDDFPTLQLPGDKLTYSTKRAYPITFTVRRADKATLLFVQLESFDIARHEAESPGWAIPMKYSPRTDDERIAQALEFDEGWEDAEPECIFVCDHRFSVFWRAAVARAKFGLTTTDAESLYVVTLGDRELESLGTALSAWAS
jgi:hypothetical protein